MTRKLFILDVALAAAAVYGGFQLHNEWLAAKAREAARLHRPIHATPAPPFHPLPTPPAVMATGYSKIAQEDLLDRSRNPTVVEEVKPTPPPPPVPPLPIFHGMMNLDGVSAILSEKAGSLEKEVRLGEMIGPFKLKDVNSTEIVLDWNGQVIHKSLDEVRDHSAAPETAGPTRTEAPPPAQPAQAPVKVQIGPGQDTGRGTRTCDANDSYPGGAVVDGYRKRVVTTPFGQQCFWEPVGR